jgi:hypothetical protein
MFFGSFVRCGTKDEGDLMIQDYDRNKPRDVSAKFVETCANHGRDPDHLVM